MFSVRKGGKEHTFRGTSQVERFFKTMRTLILGKSIGVDTAHRAIATAVRRINVSELRSRLQVS